MDRYRLLGLPLYGALTFLSSLDPWPNPNTHLEAWSRFVTTDFYVVKPLFASILGIIYVIFGTFALGAYLATSRAGRLGLVAMVVTVLGSALFLTIGGVSTFSTPEDRRLLEDLAHQIGVAAHATLLSDGALRLSADLQCSRERLVEAREEERRRLRRDLHDGLGPQLSSQALMIDGNRGDAPHPRRKPEHRHPGAHHVRGRQVDLRRHAPGPTATSSRAPMGPRRYGRSMPWPTGRRSSAPRSRGA